MIKIGEYYIEPLEFDYRLFTKRISQGKGKNGKGSAGNEYNDVIGYFPTIPSALKRIRKIEVDKQLSDIMVDLDEAIKIIQKTTTEFENTIKDIKYDSNMD